MLSEDIQRLREITSALPPFPETIASRPGFKIHRMESGTSLSMNLDTVTPDNKAANALWFNSQGTIFDAHVHKGREWIIVISGSLYLQIGDVEERRLLPGMSAIIEPNTIHAARFTEDCWYYAITIPRDPSWPA